MQGSALVATGHGYEKSDRGRCEAFDAFEILANPLGGFGAADRESRVFRPVGDKPGSGVCYGSHALYLMRRKDEATRGRNESGPLFVGVHHGGGRQVWHLPTCYHDRGETLAALLAMPERALYSLLHGIVDLADGARRQSAEATRHEWAKAYLDGRIRKKRRAGAVHVHVETEFERDLRTGKARPSCIAMNTATGELTPA